MNCCIEGGAAGSNDCCWEVATLAGAAVPLPCSCICIIINCCSSSKLGFPLPATAAFIISDALLLVLPPPLGERGGFGARPGPPLVGGALAGRMALAGIALGGVPPGGA